MQARIGADDRGGQLGARFRDMVEQVPGIVYVEVGEGAGSTTYVSPRIHAVLGYPPERFVEDPSFWSSIVHPDDAKRMDDADHRADEDGRTYLCEYRLRAADGTYRWFRDEAQRRTDVDEPHWLGLMVDITEQKAAELALRELESRYRNLVEQLPAATYIDGLDEAMTSAYVSPQVERLLGLSREDFADLDGWAARLHPDDREAALRGAREGAAAGEPFSLEYRMVRPDGSIVWIRDQCAFLHDEDGTPVAIQGLYSDVTEQKERERELQEAVTKFQALVERSPAVVYIEDPECDDMLYISPRYEEWFGYSPQARMNDPALWQRLVHPDDRERAKEVSDRASETGEDLTIEYRMFGRDGSMRWIRDETTLVRNDDGSPRFWLGIMLDITERVGAEHRVAEVAARFQALVEQIPAVTYIDPLTPEPVRSLYVSPQIEQLLGIPAEVAMTDDEWWNRAVHPDDREAAMAAALAADAGEVPYVCEYRMVRPDGSVVWVRDEARLIRDDGGRPRYWQGVLYDVTDRKNAEQDLTRALALEQEAVARLQQADDVKTAFLTAVSHDLRTPLAAILGSAVTLENEDELGISPEERRSLIRAVANKTRRLSQLVTDLLDMDRLARGVVEPRREPVDVGSLVARMVAESDLFDDERHVSVECMPVVVPADASMLERIVENLLANTAKHAGAGARVWVRVAPAPGGALLMVEDDGPGVPVALHERLFQPFERGPSANPQSPGVGVGLSLVAKFAELHGGRAWVEDREGGGASFRAFLPEQPGAPAPP